MKVNARYVDKDKGCAAEAETIEMAVNVNNASVTWYWYLSHSWL